MSTNFKNGYTNTEDGLKLPLGDIYKRPWELKQTEIFDDFFTFNADNYDVQKTGTGAVAINNNEVTECSAKKNLKIKDLTGAGDLFASGFLHGFINKKSIKESLEAGTAMSSKIIQIIGARLNR